MTDLINRLMMFIGLIILLVPTVTGIGVAPAWQDHDFESGREIKSKIRVINDENQEFRLLVYTRGMFSERLEFEEQIYSVSTDQNEVTIPFTFYMPEKILVPGTQSTEILVLMLPKSISDEDIFDEGKIKATEAMVLATKQLIVKFNTVVPYDGKYVDAQVFVNQATDTQPLRFGIALYSLGTDDIKVAWAEIDILDPNGNVVGSLETEKVSLSSKSEGRVVASWPDAGPGDYTAVFKIHYDEEQIELKKNFYVGNLLIDITNVGVDHFKLGEIVRLDIYLKSLWNTALDDVYGVLKVYDGERVAYEYKTTSVDIDEFAFSTVTAFWDTKKVEPGSYDVKVELYYSDKKTETEFKAKLGYEEIEIIGFGSTGQMITGEQALSTDSWLTIVVVILVMLNGLGFWWFRRNSKEMKKEIQSVKKTEKKEEKKEESGAEAEKDIPKPEKPSEKDGDPVKEEGEKVKEKESEGTEDGDGK